MNPFRFDKRFVANWLKAFMVSPGVLFPAAYLFLYLSSGLFLNGVFKKELQDAYALKTANSRRLAVGSLKLSVTLGSVTLNDITTEPARASADSRPRIINAVEIPLPDLADILLFSSARRSSARSVCETVLAEESNGQ
ncbi:MAG: hypothetical protein HGB20_01675 [Chlorobiaceae bacterium]|jgi:hypothetical protein|nr:hypothetical protein [Chlorobiaceae bacterium]